MIKLKSKRFHRSLSMFRSSGGSSNGDKEYNGGTNTGEIKWELRPGGMLVQKRDIDDQNLEKEGCIVVRVANGSQWHDITIQATSTFGEMKMLLSLVTGLKPKEQRVLFKGKEREDIEHLHMVGVGDRDKIVVLEDPAIKEKKQHGLLAATNENGAPNNHPISV
ncbi:hypothetical protein R6Q57_026684 [Mikania cordata]